MATEPVGDSASRFEHFEGEGAAVPPESAGVEVRSSRHLEVSFGPLPPPAFLRSFEEILPGAAERVFTMAEKQQSHRHAVEGRETGLRESELALLFRGQWMGFAFGMLALIGAVILVILGRSVEGLTAMLLPVATIIGIFTMAKRFRRRASPPHVADNDSDPSPQLPKGPE